jgi:EmrB/QacA subfamily drug resistance transporter
MLTKLPREALVPMIVACGLFMENLDSTVLATAIPAIATDIGVNPLRLNLAITSYLLSLAVFIPISGWVADRFGARTVFRAAIVVFVCGSILCGFSTSLWNFVLFRILQGMGGAMMVPVGRLVLLRSVPRADLVRAMAFLTVPALLGPMLGPPVGGFITTYADWRWIFWINVPIGALGVVLVTLFIEQTREPHVPSLDFRGFLMTAVGLAGLIFGFESAGRGLLSNVVVVALLGVGAAAIILYLFHARRVAAPVVDLGLLRIRTFRASIMGGFMFRIGIGALPFLLPLLLQIGFGLNPFHSGLLTFASAAGSMTMKMTAGPILKRLGFKRVLIANALVSAVFVAACALFRASTPVALIFGVLLFGGFFRSLQFTSINTIAYAEIPPERMSRATSFSSMMQQLSLSVGVGMAALLLHVTMVVDGRQDLLAGDFWPAFCVAAGIAALSALVYVSLPSNAGEEMARGAARLPRRRRGADATGASPADGFRT